MAKIPAAKRHLLKAHALAGLGLCAVGALLAFVGVAAAPSPKVSTAGSWTIVPSGNGSTVNALVGVTCVSSSDCWTVGRQRTGSTWQTLIDHWDGNSWNVVASPNTSTSDNNFLYGVACTSASQCWAVGFHGVMTFGVGQPLIEQWDGINWTIYSSPLANPVAQDGLLSSVTCNSVSDCWAVGYQLSGNFNQTLIYHWNGSIWAALTSANTSAAESNVLNGVTCLSASDCWAVGNHDVGTPVGGAAPQATLTEHWDGTAWTIAPSPDPTTNYDVLYSVSCGSSSDCTAVGLFAQGTIYQTLVEHWNGLLWQVVQSPNPNPNQDNALESVTCNSTSDCWAVGYFNAGDVNNPVDDTLIIHWDGAAWSIVSSPNRSDYQFNLLYGVTCSSATDCWAVGTSDTPNAITLVEHYAVTPVPVFQIVSRMTHGNAGTFDILLLGNDPPPPNFLGIECRSGGANGNYQIVFTFVNTLTNVDDATVTSGTGTVASSNVDGSDAHNYIVNLTGVNNSQVVTVGLTNVTDSAGDFSPSAAARMGVLIGDTNADGVVNSADISQTTSQSGQPLSNSNFREDVNADGLINSADISLVKSKSGSALP